jgi:uncharacterized protein DUF6497
MRWAIAIALFGSSAWAEPVAVPSGQPVEFLDLVQDAEGSFDTTWRFRFVAPQIAREAGSVSLETALADIDALCLGFVLNWLGDSEETPDQIVISLSDRPVEFGAAAPEATQFFEAYRIEDDACIWEGF